MIIQCEKCKTKFRLDDSRVTPSGIRVRCSRCSHTFVVKRDQPEEEVDFDTILQGLGGDEPEDHAEADDSSPDSADSAVVSRPPVEPRPEFGQEEEEEEPHEGFDDEDGAQGAPLTGELSSDIESMIASLAHGEEAQEPEPAVDETEAADEMPEPDSDEEDVPEESYSEFLRKGKGLPQFQGESEPDGSDAVHDERHENEPEEESADLSCLFDVDTVKDESSCETETEPECPTPQEDGAEAEPSPLSSIAADSGENLTIRQHLWPMADSKEEGQEADGMPPLSITSRKKRSPLVSIAVGAVLLLLLGGGLYILAGQGGGLGSMLPESLRSVLGTDNQSKGPVVIRALEGVFLKNKSEGEIFVVRGEAFNVSAKHLMAIQVKGKIFGAKGEVLEQRTVFCGNVFAADQLAFQSYSSMEKTMSRQFGETLANLDVQPGTAIPFVIVFKDVPRDATDFGVEAIQAVSSAP